MATRTIENRKDRLVTILVAPLMSCSARLPVYIADDRGCCSRPAALWHSRCRRIMTVCDVPARARRGVRDGVAFQEDTPPRRDADAAAGAAAVPRCPRSAASCCACGSAGSLFLRRAGTVILALSIILWALMTYPKPADPNADAATKLRHSIAGRSATPIEPAIRRSATTGRSASASSASSPRAKFSSAPWPTFTTSRTATRKTKRCATAMRAEASPRRRARLHPARAFGAHGLLRSRHAVRQDGGHRRERDGQLALGGVPMGVYADTGVGRRDAGLPGRPRFGMGVTAMTVPWISSWYGS